MKKIIEYKGDANYFGILLIDKGGRGYLKFFNFDYSNGVLKEITELENRKYVEIYDNIICSAEIVCEENKAILWSY